MLDAAMHGDVRSRLFVLLAGALLASGVVQAQSEREASGGEDGAARYWRSRGVELNPLAGPQRDHAAAPAARAAAPDLVIENEHLTLRWAGQSERFTLVARRPRRVFLSDGSFGEPGGVARVTRVRDATLGDGKAIEVAFPGGRRETIALFPRLPFAWLRSTIGNPGPDAVVVKSVRPWQAAVDIGVPATQLRTLGTGGLSAAGKDPGSYTWLAVADPGTRKGVVFGVLTHERGDGVFFSRVLGTTTQVGLQLDYGRLKVGGGGSADLEAVLIGFFEDGRLGLEAWADAVARVYRVELPPQPVGYCTWYSRPNGGASDAEHIRELAAFAARELAPFGFSVVQIDDGWQAGFKRSAPRSSPKKDFTMHRADGPYPEGMKRTADEIKAVGLVPGIWFMPFAGTQEDPFFAAHENWFVKGPDGRPFDVPWGGTSLDMTHPGARAHLRDVAGRIARDWGYRYVKVDGLWTGTATRQLYVNSGYKDDSIGEAVFHDPARSNVEAYRDGLKLLREAVGKDTFILGCNGPQNMRSYGGAFGLVDAMRVGPDNGADWNRLLRGPAFGSRHYFLHRRVWYNDPDPVYVRESMPLDHARLIASWVALSDQLNLSSEWLPGLPPERLEILKRTMPYHQKTARPVDIFDRDLPRVWLVSDEGHRPRRDVVGLFNWEDSEQEIEMPFAKLGLDASAEYEAFDYWADRSLGRIKGGLRVKVPRQSCVILALRAATSHPQLISTSRHVTQGMVDVLAEQWDDATRTLSGRSKVVGKDPYEIRVVGGTGAAAVELSAGDRAAGVTATVTVDGRVSRARITSPTSREVSWALRFE